jgi:hypothetical protein
LTIFHECWNSVISNGEIEAACSGKPFPYGEKPWVDGMSAINSSYDFAGVMELMKNHFNEEVIGRPHSPRHCVGEGR